MILTKYKLFYPKFSNLYLKMEKRKVYNFSAGPCILPQEVLKQAQEECLDWHGSGVSVMEMSHRSKEFI